MRINLAQPIGCGNAARLVVSPTAGEVRWRVLRKPEAGGLPPVFSGPMDSAAFLVHDGSDRFLTDSRLLINGVVYHYAVFGQLPSDAWAAPILAQITPAATFDDLSVDVQEVLRDRLDVTLNSMIQRGHIRLSKPEIQVISIPFYEQGTAFPVVTVLFGNGSSTVRGLGELVAQDTLDGDSWIGTQGWHSAVTLEVSSWSLNAEERNILRRALEASLAANLAILEEAGLNLIEVQSVQDTEDTQSMNAPIYQTVIRVGCQTVVAVTDEDGLFVDVVPTRQEV